MLGLFVLKQFNLLTQEGIAMTDMKEFVQATVTYLPGNLRYQPKALVPIFGYDYLYRALADVEIATLQVLGDIGIIPSKEMELLTPDMVQAVKSIPTSLVDKIEREITKHDVRAWVRVAQEILPPSLGRWLHVPLTSYDALDTARTVQFSRAYQQALKPASNEVMRVLVDLVRQYADQLQIGRTHGQHALPITVGFWLATILNRLLYNAKKMDWYARHLVGKISGAVGAYNAQVGLGFAERCGDETFEERVLEKIGLKDLKPAVISTQILPPEPLAYFLFSCCTMSAALGQFGRDCRQLMRSEIAEVAEAYEPGQVGSSTMAHKRNPINFENLEGMWLRTKNEFGKVLDTLISEHQRDLVGSSLMRDFPIIVVNLQSQLDTLLRKNKAGVPFLRRLTISTEARQNNFAKNAFVVLAEPIYIALIMADYQGDAHALVNEQLIPLAQQEQETLIEALGKLAVGDREIASALENMNPDISMLFCWPEKYVGHASQKALEIADAAEAFIKSHA